MNRQDAALSDIVGTIMLLGVTVLLAGVAVAGMYSASKIEHSTPPSLDVKVNAVPTSNSLLLTHAGGAAFDASDLIVNVTGVSGTSYTPAQFTLHDADASLTTWDVGHSVTIPIPPVTAKDHLEVQVISKKLGAVIATGTLDVSPPTGGAAPPSPMTVTLLDPATPPDVTAGSALRLAVRVDHPDGRKAVADVSADLTPLNGSSVTPLYDDGTNGDTLAGDMEYASYVLVPAEAADTPGPRTLHITATDTDGASTTIPVDIASVIHPGLSVTNGTLSNFTIQNVTYISGGSGGNGTTTFANTTIQNVTTFAGDSVTNVTFGGNTTTIQQYDVTNLTDVTFAGDTYLNQTDVTNLTDVTFAGDTFIDQFNVTDLSNATFTNTSIQNFTATSLTNATFGNISNLTIQNIGAPLGAPGITGFSPVNGTSGTLVTMTGNNLSTVTSVSLVDSTGAGWAATSWFAQDNGTLYLYPSSAASPGAYKLRVSSPSGNATTTATFALEAGSGFVPSSLTISPTHGKVGDTITVSGLHLDTVRRVTLVNASRSFVTDASWWQQGNQIVFSIPVAAAPPGASPYDYVVELTGSSGSPVDVPQALRVDAEPAPIITTFTPTSGVPFTQINVVGQNFVNVQSVLMNQTAVYFTVVSPTQIMIVTHGGVAPGYYSIIVTTATGSDSTSPGHGGGYFHALHAPIVPVYPPNVFQYFAVWAQHNTSCSPGDCANIYVKFRLNATVTVDGVSGLKLVNSSSCSGSGSDSSGDCGFFTYNPFKPGNIPPANFGTAVCANASTGTYVFHYNTSLPNYISSTYTLAFYPTFSFSPSGGSNGGGGNTLHTVSVTTTDPSQYFNLAPTDAELTVYDKGQPSNNSFQNCG